MIKMRATYPYSHSSPSGSPFVAIIDFLEEVTHAPFENIFFYNHEDPRISFPLTELLEFVEDKCEGAAIPHLNILSLAQIEGYQQQYQKLLSKKLSANVETQSAIPPESQNRHTPRIISTLHTKIAELRCELDEVSSSLKTSEEKVAVLLSTLSLQGGTLKEQRMIIDGNEKRHSEDPRQRKKTLRSAKTKKDPKPLYGLDGADERMSRSPSQHGRSRGQRHDRPGPVPTRSWINGDDEMTQISASRGSSTPVSLSESSRPYDSCTQRSSGNIGSMPPPSPPRTFAPGLALRKPKVNPYDPQNRLAPKEEYSFMRERQDAVVRGAWTAIDPDSGTRLWDRRHHAEVEERAQARSEGRVISRASSARPDPWSGWASSTTSEYSDVQSVKSESNSTIPATIDARFENPDLDVDPEVREKFIGVQDVLRQNRGPLSAFEQRNNLSYNPSAPVHVIIGGEIAKTLVSKVDRRGELRDRHGNYVDGINRGLMKKRFEEDRKRKIEERDDELQRASKERRAWMALTPEERERRLMKSQRNKSLVALLGAGLDNADNADLYNYETIPVREAALKHVEQC